MRLDSILSQNEGFVRGREARPLPPPETIPLAVVACYDPRLDALLYGSLGIDPGEVFLLRTAGALLQPGSSALRSLGLAIYLFGVTEVIVVGHTSCRMADFQSAAFIDAFRRRGVRREAFGQEDLRVWAGAIPDPRRGVAMSLANIAAAPFLPQDLLLAGVVLDDTTGALEVVVRPGETPRAVTAEPPVEEAAAQETAAEVETEAKAEVEIADPLAGALGELVHHLQAAPRWRDELRQVRRELAREKNPLAKLGLLERLGRKAAAESREVREAFARVQRATASSAGRQRQPEDLVRLFRHLTEE
jgi:carbonic anhydrase